MRRQKPAYYEKGTDIDMKYVLGIDQGGSKTHAIIMDETGLVRGLGKSYGVCHSSSTMEKAMQAVEESAREALKQGGLSMEDISCAAAGMTGVDWNYEAKLLENAIRKKLEIKNVYVVNDCIIAMRAGTTNEVSGVLCVGSGTNCAVKNKDDLFVYGFYIADEHQGGMSLGRKTIRAVFDSHMGLIGETVLTGELLSYFKVSTVDELLFKSATGQIEAREYLYIPQILEKAGLAGDKEAVAIWEQYGKTLAGYVTVRMKKMELRDEEIEIILSGSVFKCRVPEFKAAVSREIKAYAPNALIKESVYEPVVGAGLLGLDHLFKIIEPEVYENLEKSAECFPIKR